MCSCFNLMTKSFESQGINFNVLRFRAFPGSLSMAGINIFLRKVSEVFFWSTFNDLWIHLLLFIKLVSEFIHHLLVMLKCRNCKESNNRTMIRKSTLLSFISDWKELCFIFPEQNSIAPSRYSFLLWSIKNIRARVVFISRTKANIMLS